MSSSASTANASPATCSARAAATAGRNCIPPCGRWPRPAAAWCFTCGRKAAASASRQDQGLQIAGAGLRHRGGNEKLGFKMDLREYGLGAQILCDLGLKTIRLLTNNPRKLVGLAGYGLKNRRPRRLRPENHEYQMAALPIKVKPNPHNERYLKTKRTRETFRRCRSWRTSRRQRSRGHAAALIRCDLPPPVQTA
jgi:hypothetical protein